MGHVRQCDFGASVSLQWISAANAALSSAKTYADTKKNEAASAASAYEGENETYIEASAENSGSVLYDKEIRDKPRTRRTKRNV